MKTKTIKFLFLIILSSLLSCGESSSKKEKIANASGEPKPADSSYIVDVTEMDYAFGMPEEIKSGWVTFRMKNKGKEEHLGLLQKLPDSLNSLSVSTVRERFLEDSLPMGDWKAGPGILSPGRTGKTTVYLKPGLYILWCTIRTPEGTPHYKKGMLRSFRVTQELGGEKKPKADVNITVSRYAYSTDQPIGPGTHTFNVQFADDGIFDVFIAHLKEDQDMEDVFNWRLRAPSPVEFLGGTEQQPGLFQVDLNPGRYVFYSTQGGLDGLAEEITIPEEGKAPAISGNPVNSPISWSLSDSDSVLTAPEGRTLVTFENNSSHRIDYLWFWLKPEFSEKQFLEYIQPGNLWSRGGPGYTKPIPANGKKDFPDCRRAK
ncbi:hypothetical protein C7S20_03585 [Christiangramia fulva]|uniref:Lipoprotein n=1 Tax=Christiangramia fulva TaxID=2126553 RepID=A0A2R3Z2E4_9FLAO|nr:hypothetical protein [Christiangramia fulva]AVR44412.1 hypothetical protein C7S20_03585 [Christiangramia fulva]